MPAGPWIPLWIEPLRNWNSCKATYWDSYDPLWIEPLRNWNVTGIDSVKYFDDSELNHCGIETWSFLVPQVPQYVSELNHCGIETQLEYQWCCHALISELNHCGIETRLLWYLADPAVPLNWTTAELKHIGIPVIQQKQKSLNWTTAELKPTSYLMKRLGRRLWIEPLRNWNPQERSRLIFLFMLWIEPLRNWNLIVSLD